ncbi:MAG: rimM [Hydrocarboniphaga sp.]|uniref:ribosome maturation factor RimM n=1 Tax=Hydrocarboniphaga sp. TaxID=2033016 RepID=UPI00262EF618|nr:ribosome maturation factor RimM [Hydrocarboniphaga sp.]MDB5971842.1 rimM [Hydrocarboniphaga sp.]
MQRLGERLVLGRIAGVFGVRGWVKLRSHTRPIENLLDYPRWWLVHEGREFPATMIEGRMHGDGLVAQISDEHGKPIDDRDVAAALIGAEIHVARHELPEPEEGQYYWFDLVGLKVRNIEEVDLGEVDSVTSNGAQDVLVIKQGEVERLIPFVKGPIIQAVDLEQGLIVADWQPDF